MGKKKKKKPENRKEGTKKPIAVMLEGIVLLLKALVNFVLFILKTPYYICKGAIFLLTKTKKKTDEIKINKKRDAIKANYESLSVIETQSGELGKWEKATTEADSKIGIILGARGSGKTAFGIKFLENVYAKTNKKCYAIGFNKEDMPSWIEIAQDITELKNNAFVLIDEGGVLFSSRDSMSKANKFLSDLILISRHKNLSILFISQNSANLDVDILRQADYLVFKKSSLLQLDFERKKIKEIYEQTSLGFEKYTDRKGITYIYSDLFRGFVENPLPSFWNINISKSFK